MLLSQAIDGFMLALSSGDYAASTVALYRYTLTNLLQWCNNPPVENITDDSLRRFMAYLKTEYRHGKTGEPISPAYIDNHWKSLRTFFAWASKTLHIPRPDMDLPRPVYRSSEIVPFSDDEARKIVRATEVSVRFKRANTKEYQLKKANALRDKAIILALLDTGLRVGELCRLQVEDVNLSTGEVMVKPFSDRP